MIYYHNNPLNSIFSKHTKSNNNNNKYNNIEHGGLFVNNADTSRTTSNSNAYDLKSSVGPCNTQIKLDYNKNIYEHGKSYPFFPSDRINHSKSKRPNNKEKGGTHFYSLHKSYVQNIPVDDRTTFLLLGYRYNSFKFAITCIFSILTAGLFFLLLLFLPRLKFASIYDASPLGIAHVIALKDSHNKWHVLKIKSVYLNLPYNYIFPHNDNTAAKYASLTPNTYSESSPPIIHNLKFIEFKCTKLIFNDFLDEFSTLLSSINYEHISNLVLSSQKKEVNLLVADDSTIPNVEPSVLTGLDSITVKKLLSLFGLNEIVIVIPSLHSLIKDQLFTFFCLFQFLSILLWSVDEYLQYAMLVLAIMCFAVGFQVYTIRKGLLRIKNVSKCVSIVKVLRDGNWISISSLDLFPGDIYQIDLNSQFSTCDSLLLTGSCTVNEDVLTGESIPLIKTPIKPDELPLLKVWISSFHKVDSPLSRSIIFTGSRIIKHTCKRDTTSTKHPNMNIDDQLLNPQAVVLRTGFNTLKGSLIRLVLHPDPGSSKFEVDAFKFLFFFFFIAFSGLVYSLFTLSKIYEMSIWKLLIRSADIFTITVPPALPATLSAAIGFYMKYLLKRKVNCFIPSKVPSAGRTDMVIFDKTGTITESTLSVFGIHPTTNPKPTNTSNKGINVRFVSSDSKTISNYSVSSSSSSLSLGPDSGPFYVDEVYFCSSHDTNGSKSIIKLSHDDFPFEKSVPTNEPPLNSQFSQLFDSSPSLYYAFSLGFNDQDFKEYSDPSKALVSSHIHGHVSKSSPSYIKSLLSHSSENVSPIILCMSSCHAIVNFDGEPLGDFMDVEMFNFTRWRMYELNNLEFKKHTEHVLSPTKLVQDSCSSDIRANANYSSTLNWLFNNDSYPSLMVSPYYMQIYNIRNIENDYSKYPLNSQNYGNKNASFNSAELCLESLYGILYRVELLSIRKFEFSSESRRMSVVVKRSTIGQSVNLEKYLNGMDFDEMRKRKYIDIDPVVIYENLDNFNCIERAMEPELEIYIKGAPENVRSLCDPVSIPADFDEKLKFYSHKGYRVIACASKKLGPLSVAQVYKASQIGLEENAKFSGFIVFENKLKSSSKKTCCILDSSNLETSMCTGDNLLTSVSVARKCHIIKPGTAVFIPHFTEINIDGLKKKSIVWKDIDDNSSRLDNATLIPSINHADEYRIMPGKRSVRSLHSNRILSTNGNGLELSEFDTLTVKSTSTHAKRKSTVLKKSNSIEFNDYCLAVSGDVFKWIQQNASVDVFERILLKTKVYARMLPQQKLSLVEYQESFGHTVFFVGDGANDIAALRAANVGLSVSGNESSIAAPFVASSGGLSKILDVISCGRASLVTSFCCFKYMSLYSIIQLVSIIIIYTEHSNMTDPQLMCIDIVVALPLTFAISMFNPNNRIGRKRPAFSLMNSHIITSLVLQMIVQFVTQLVNYRIIIKQPIYEPPVPTEWRTDATYVQSAIFVSSLAIYLVTAIAICAGGPHRQPLYTNFIFLAITCFYTIFVIFLIVFSTNKTFSETLFESPALTNDVRFISTMVSIVGVAFSLIAEKLMANSLAQIISNYIRRVSILTYIYKQKILRNGCKNDSTFTFLKSRIYAIFTAIPSSSLKSCEKSTLINAQAEYYKKHNKRYILCRENMQKDFRNQITLSNA